MNNAQLIDVSKWDGGPDDNYQVIDFARYAQSYPGVVVKVSEGRVKDPLFARQWSASRGRVARQAYHFFRSFVTQKLAVQDMMALLGNETGDMEAVLDAELDDGSTMVMSLMHQWADEYFRLSGQWPMIYSTIPFLTKHGAFAKTIWGAFKNPWLANCRFWLAQYPFDALESMTGYIERGDALREILIREVMEGRRTLAWPKVAPPFKGVDRWQWTSRLPPELVPGYYLGPNHKLAVDHNFEVLTDEAFRQAYPIKLTGTPEPPTGGTMLYGKVNATGGLNLRDGPGASFLDIGDLLNGWLVEADREQSGWWHIVKANGQVVDGWASAAYITVAPAPTPPPPAITIADIKFQITIPDGTYTPSGWTKVS